MSKKYGPHASRNTVLAIFQDNLLSSREASEKYHVSQYTVRLIRQGKSFSGITGKTYERSNRKPVQRLTDRQVLEVFNDTTSTRQELAARYNTTYSYIAQIQTGATRRDVTGKEYEPKPKTRLTPMQVLEIHESTDLYGDISQKYGISKTNVYYIKSGRTWKHIPRQIDPIYQ